MLNLNWPCTSIYKFINFKISTPDFSLNSFIIKYKWRFFCQKGQDTANYFPNMFASVCNPAWQVKELLMQNPQSYLFGFFAWNHPQMSPICPFWSVCSWKHCSHGSLLWSQGSSDMLGDRAAYWGKNTMNFIYWLCGSYRKWNSEPDWNRASGIVQWKKIIKGYWKSWAALQGRLLEWAWKVKTPVTA